VDYIKIIKTENAKRVSEKPNSCIFFPFKNWLVAKDCTGGGWFSSPDEDILSKHFYPLVAINQNPWESLLSLGVQYLPFKDAVEYECPYTQYKNYWAVPVLIFTEKLDFWLNRYKIKRPQLYSDIERVKQMYPLNTKHGFPFTKIHRALLGTGYSSYNIIEDGYGHIHDAVVSLDNGDYLGVKVWVWFSK
jgi:hypothetical protein